MLAGIMKELGAGAASAQHGAHVMGAHATPVADIIGEGFGDIAAKLHD